MHVSTHMPVGMESEQLREAAGPAHPEAMLDLEPQQVVRTEDAGLGQPLTHQPLEADEGKYLSSPSSRAVRTAVQPITLRPVCLGVSRL